MREERKSVCDFPYCNIITVRPVVIFIVINLMAIIHYAHADYDFTVTQKTTSFLILQWKKYRMATIYIHITWCSHATLL